jgi:hypothetical protein
VVGADPAQLALALADLALELVDQAQARLDRSLPWLRQAKPREQLAATHTEEIGAVCPLRRLSGESTRSWRGSWL